jgi:hypothetical protein
MCILAFPNLFQGGWVLENQRDFVEKSNKKRKTAVPWVEQGPRGWSNHTAHDVKESPCASLPHPAFFPCFEVGGVSEICKNLCQKDPAISIRAVLWFEQGLQDYVYSWKSKKSCMHHYTILALGGVQGRVEGMGGQHIWHQRRVRGMRQVGVARRGTGIIVCWLA